jgi:hypothetical protein
MSVERFVELAAAYGAVLERWPEHEVIAARSLLAVSDEARRALEMERALDSALAEVAESARAALPPELDRRLAEIPLRAARPVAWRGGLRSFWAPILGWCAAAAVGLALGLTASTESSLDGFEAAESVTTDEDLVVSLALGEAVDSEILP